MDTRYFDLFAPPPNSVSVKALLDKDRTEIEVNLFTTTRPSIPVKIEPTLENKIDNLRDEMRMLVESFKQKAISEDEFYSRYELLFELLEDLGVPRDKIRPATKRKFVDDKSPMNSTE